jgi:hypothetical protein
MRSKAILAGAVVLAVASASASAQILSSKRGFADTGASYGNLQATNAGWYYTWGTGTGSPGNFDANHYPMIWGGTPSQSTLNNLVSRNPTYVLGFNEPERTDQANMTVAQAISAWTPISNAFTGTSTKLVSPGVADTGGATGGQQWLSSFVSQARAANLKLDAIAFHWYGVSTPADPAGAASSFLGRVQSYWNTYQLPIFITEFAIHDWGGAYTDAEIAEANRQFLGIVIPALESRSYVAGYAWYHWFGDSKLYDNNLTPTTLGYNYIGVVGPGATSNISGQSFGEHVAPLTGGTLSVTGAAPTLKFIHALSGESNIAGTTDWTLAGLTNWVKIQPGARLTKTGANTVTFNTGTLTNNGTLEVAQGRLNLGANVAGNGTVRVKGGTLALSSLATLRFTPLIDIRAGATLDASGLANASISITDGRSLINNGTVIGNVVVNSAAMASGAGTFNGNLTTLSLGNLRVGTDRLGVAKRAKIDDLEAYSVGDVVSTAAANWTAHMGTTAADIVDVNGTRALSFGATGGFAGVSRALPAVTALDDSATGTFFFRINAGADNLNHNVGVGDQAQTGMVDFADFEAQLRLKQGTTAGTFAIDARSGGAFSSTLASGLTLNTWYNVWMVVNNATDRFDVYLNTGSAAATAANKLNGSALLFRNGTNQDLDTFLAYAGAVPVGNAVRLDGISFQTGIDLTNPMAGFDPGYVWSPQTMSVTGNYTHNSGANLAMDLGTSAGALVSDSLHVDGAIQLAGTLKLEKADGFAATLGQSSTLMSGASIAGAFQSITGVAIDAGTSLAVTYTATDVLVTLATPGDTNLDGAVDFDDLLALAQHYGSGALEQWATGDFDGTGATTFDDLLALAQHYGTSALITDSFAGDWALAQSLVPEPSAAMIAACGFAVRRRRRVKEE